MITLGAVTHEGESLYLWTEQYLTAEHGIALLKTFLEEFSKKLIVFLDCARTSPQKNLREFFSDGRSNISTTRHLPASVVRNCKCGIFGPDCPS